MLLTSTRPFRVLVIDVPTELESISGYSAPRSYLYFLSRALQTTSLICSSGVPAPGPNGMDRNLSTELDATILALEEMHEPLIWSSEPSTQTSSSDTVNPPRAAISSQSALDEFEALCSDDVDDADAPKGSMVLAPLPNDVKFGKGNRMAHLGNVNYRAECQRLFPRFLAKPSSTVKEEVALEIMGFVFEQGGLFLENDGNNSTAGNKWRIAKFELALSKTKQLLTDAKKKHDAAKRTGQQIDLTALSGDAREVHDNDGATSTEGSSVSSYT